MALHDQWNIATGDFFRRRVEIAMFTADGAIQYNVSAAWHALAGCYSQVLRS